MRTKTYADIIDHSQFQIMRCSVQHLLVLAIFTICPSVQTNPTEENNFLMTMTEKSICAFAQYFQCIIANSIDNETSTVEKSWSSNDNHCFEIMNEKLEQNNNSQCGHIFNRLEMANPLYDNVQLSVKFSNSRTLKIYFPRYRNSVFYILEIRNLKYDEQRWKYAGVFRSDAIEYPPPDLCNSYEIRAFTVLDNGTLIFSAGQPHYNVLPPEFSLTSFNMKNLYLDKVNNQVVAHYAWSHPRGYRKEDIKQYEVDIVTVQCPMMPLASTPHYRTEIHDEGADLFITLAPETVAHRCWYKVSIRGESICGQVYTNTIAVYLKLKCYAVANYRCPPHEQKPRCLNRIDFAPMLHNDVDYSIKLHWKQPQRHPVYLHLRWGPVKSVRILSSGFSHNYLGQLPPKKTYFDSVYNWKIDHQTEEHIKLEPNTTSLELSHIHFNQSYGVQQLCAVYNLEFKKPTWRKVPLTIVHCNKSMVCDEPKADFNQTDEIIQEIAKSVVQATQRTGLFKSPNQRIDKWTPEGDVQLRVRWELNANVPADIVQSYQVNLVEKTPCQSMKTKHPAILQDSTAFEVTMIIYKEILQEQCQLNVQIKATVSTGIGSVQEFPLILTTAADNLNNNRSIFDLLCFNWSGSCTSSVENSVQRVSVHLPDPSEEFEREALKRRSILIRWGALEQLPQQGHVFAKFQPPVQSQLLNLSETEFKFALPMRRNETRSFGYEIALVYTDTLNSSSRSKTEPSCSISLLQKCTSPDADQHSAYTNNTCRAHFSFFSSLIITTLAACMICKCCCWS
ncbi:hypothetical protein T4E_10957 [Trichinella pseudospiralis]|uniref:Uncharacterized protein n=1 Tax=Trichinella pseudospiralis TaxID=6337 RepID=A0A0V0Y4B5_TRIPS|nr:hypothetical protein T4E_10957 [Trichinella pseudospiralis]KRX95303.1 hypothetical protein T4E_10957 [Trichinella pseudospiralis]KRX95306.1 hypothetical protein T4E_10957 [Trichinella pseudospiralis]